MRCPKCNGKCKTVQTHAEVEEEKITVMEPRGGNTKSLNDYELVEKTKTLKRPITRRKIKCLECGAYFFTVERFEHFTEKTIRDGIDMDKIIAALPVDKQKVTIRLGRK